MTKNKLDRLLEIYENILSLTKSERFNQVVYDEYKSLHSEIQQAIARLDEYERVGIIKCPICGELEVTQYGDDEYLPNLRCCNCDHVWIANGKLGDDDLIHEIEKYKQQIKQLQEKLEKFQEWKKYLEDDIADWEPTTPSLQKDKINKQQIIRKITEILGDNNDL